MISQSVPYMGVQTTKTIKYQEEMPYQIEQQTDPNQNIGWTAVLQEGSTGIREVTAQVRMIDGVEVERTEVDKQIIQQPVSRILAVGGNQPLQFLPSSSDGGTPSGAFIWPADGGYISCAFMGYAGHTGMDIAGYAGMPLRASADGVVVVSKYSAGYGYHIIIDHGAGVQTLYGHCSALYKQVGETVSQGELIAAMGRTGWATGNHVHFEVRINGQYKNPANYLFS